VNPVYIPVIALGAAVIVVFAATTRERLRKAREDRRC
jgi:hypothetical protein